MNHRETQQGPQGGNRDMGARDYGGMPSITDRQGGEAGGRDDSFGPPELGGHRDVGNRGEMRPAGHGPGATGPRATARRGKAPRNATRSDSLVAEELNERLGHDDQLDASEILVRVEDGHVLLTGEVPEKWMKRRAEDIADAIRGVRDIENLIRVDDGSKSFGTGGPVRAGLNQQGSGFSSSPPNEDWQPRDGRVD